MPSAFESVFEFLFKYISLTYAWVRAESTRRDRILMATSRVALIALLGFCLLRPTLSVSALVDGDGLRFDQIDAGWMHTCAIGVNRIAYCWGSDHYGQIGDGNDGIGVTRRPARVALGYASR